MKSRMKCFSVLALIAFGFGYSDLLVRPCWAHVGNCHNKSHEPPSPTCKVPSYHIPGTIISTVVSLYEWLDSCLGDMQDYFEEEEKKLQSIPTRGVAPVGLNEGYNGLDPVESKPEPTEVEKQTNPKGCYPKSGNPNDPPC